MSLQRESRQGPAHGRPRPSHRDNTPVCLRECVRECAELLARRSCKHETLDFDSRFGLWILDFHAGLFLVLQRKRDLHKGPNLQYAKDGCGQVKAHGDAESVQHAALDPRYGP